MIRLKGTIHGHYPTSKHGGRWTRVRSFQGSLGRKRFVSIEHCFQEIGAPPGVANAIQKKNRFCAPVDQIPSLIACLIELLRKHPEYLDEARKYEDVPAWIPPPLSVTMRKLLDEFATDVRTEELQEA